MVSIRGFCDPPSLRIDAEGQGVRATEFGDHIVVRMSTEDPLDEALLVELKKRTLDCLIIAWKGAGLEELLFQSEENILI